MTQKLAVSYFHQIWTQTWAMTPLNSPSLRKWYQTQTIRAALITAGEQTFVWLLWASTDRLGLNWQGPLNYVCDAWSIVSKPLRGRLCVTIMYWSDCDGWPWRKYKWSSRSSWGTVWTRSSKRSDTMLSLALFYLVAVICSATWTHPLPLYTETSLEPQAGKTLSFFLLFRFSLFNFLQDFRLFLEISKLLKRTSCHSDF